MVENKILKTVERSGEIQHENISRENINKYKFAPLTSCDVERSFSAYKMLFSEKRQKLTVNNMEKLMVIYCNTNYRS